MRATFALLLAPLLASPAFADGDPAQGHKLIEEKSCESCHQAKAPGDPSAFYLRKDHKVTSIEKLKAQVARCNSNLKLQMFPEDEEHIVAWLNQSYYKFSTPK